MSAATVSVRASDDVQLTTVDLLVNADDSVSFAGVVREDASNINSRHIFVTETRPHERHAWRLR